MLLAYADINAVKAKRLTFAGMVEKISNKHILKMWIKETKRLAKY